ncbi:unnamed protein product [Triticum turgidum subsp. durum]|uniref:RNase H type-1 domain-containing protein n=1 Tax=Triticum turgidum subsp. durum TaxID=4567 RepID=A0A9R1PLE8_TRITD|nr:unnamed protein product [Triticum turgidum subsp. durum]
MEGFSLAIQRSDLTIVVEMDSMQAVSMISCVGVDRSMYAPIVQEIKYLMGLRQSCIVHISRTPNKASHCLAVFARDQGRTMTWLRAGPVSMLEIVADDCKDILIE